MLDKIFSNKNSDEALQQNELVTEIINALKQVYDPEIPVNIYDLGLIYGIDIDQNSRVTIRMTLTAPGCPVAQSFPEIVADHVRMVAGVEDVIVDLVWDPPWNQDRMSEVAKYELGLF